MRCSTGCSPTPPITAGISSGTGPASSATAARSPWAKSSTRAGERWELQLKGAGPHALLAQADGRAVLRSSIREFLCSEAMHHLGVPTTRALCLVATGEQVVRDMFYDGHPRAEPGAIVCRVAPSFIRFGNFELPASRGDVTLLSAARRLHDPATHFPATLGPRSGSRETRSRALVRGGLRAHRADDRALDARRLRARRHEHRQHVDPRAHHRLRAVWLDRRLRSRLDAQHHRRARAPLSLRPSAADRLLEPRASSPTRCAPVFASADPLRGGPGALHRCVRRTPSARNIAAKLGLAECADDDVALMQQLCRRCCRRRKST